MQIAIANFSINFVRAENDRFTRTQNSIACLFFDAHWWTTNCTEQVQYFHFWQLSILSTFKVTPLYTRRVAVSEKKDNKLSGELFDASE